MITEIMKTIPSHKIGLIGKNKINVLSKLNDLLAGNFQITGSISLILNDVAERNIGDIDIVINDEKLIKLLKDTYDAKIMYSELEYINDDDHRIDHLDYETILAPVRKSNGRIGVYICLINRIGCTFTINETKVCVFLEKDHQDYDNHLIDGKVFRISDPIYSIKAKVCYLDCVKNPKDVYKVKKHINDISNYIAKYGRVDLNLCVYDLYSKVSDVVIDDSPF